jgi:hypothetical protein
LISWAAASTRKLQAAPSGICFRLAQICGDENFANARNVTLRNCRTGEKVPGGLRKNPNDCRALIAVKVTETTSA